MKTLIDADSFCYRVAFACKDESVDRAKSVLDGVIYDILLACDHDDRFYDEWQLYLSCPSKDNFRNKYAVTVPYKGNRVQEKPAHLEFLRQHLIHRHKATVAVEQEADDDVAIAATADPDTIIVSIDKDLLQVPGWHYHPYKRTHTFVSPEEGIRSFYKQLLTGDAVDNIIGLAGVGPVTANHLLSQCTNEKEMYDVCVAEYGDEARVIENARLLWLRRFENQIWEPPQ